MLRLSSSIGLAARAMRVAPARVMRPASARARQISTPSATSTTGNKAAAFGVHLTGGRRMPEKFTKPSAAGAISYVFEEGRGGITLGGIFARADTDRSGTLDMDQLSNAIAEIQGSKVSNAELEAIFFKLDLDGNGKIDFMEFEKGIDFLTWGIPKP